MKTLFFLFLFPLGALLFAMPSGARTLESQFILQQVVQANSGLGLLYLETHTKVYQVPILNSHIVGQSPVVQGKHFASQDFQQRIVWSSNALLAVETSQEQEPIHIRVKKQKDNCKSLEEIETFSCAEAFYLPLLFYTGTSVDLNKALQKLNIPTGEVSWQIYNQNYVYKIGNSLEYIIVDSQNFRILALGRQITIDNQPYPYNVYFSDWVGQIPKRVDFFIGQQKLKETIVTALESQNIEERRSQMQEQYPELF